ncbi:RodZ domain-containing protein [Marinobacter salicampi]|uniref:RodZ domain-containing protein n=1 Tax=Marinobacter salicampi TaxID=435907 RepID=UPI00140BDE34|nr:RodZ domain-containing protein [Marinobacter salicampi]
MTSEETPQQPAQDTVGTQLRKAREAAGLSIADVADSQHLRPSIIQAIENGDYGQIDTELFLKGYVRAYAEQVRMPANGLIAQLDQELEPRRREKEAAQETNPLQDIARKKQRKKKLAKAVMLVIVLAAVAYLLFRVVSIQLGDELTGVSPSDESPIIDEDAPQIPAGEDSPAVFDREPVNEAELPPVDEPSDEPADVQERGGAEGGDISSDRMAPSVSDEAVIEPDAGTESGPGDNAEVGTPTGTDLPGVSPEEGGDPVTEPAPERETSRDEAALNGVTEPADSEVEEVALAASFIDPCWVQITDADGRTIVSALFGDGDSLNVQGKAPMRVVLGAADAVSRLEFNGQIVDLSSYRIVNNRVEFTLDV